MGKKNFGGWRESKGLKRGQERGRGRGEGRRERENGF